MFGYTALCGLENMTVVLMTFSSSSLSIVVWVIWQNMCIASLYCLEALRKQNTSPRQTKTQRQSFTRKANTYCFLQRSLVFFMMWLRHLGRIGMWNASSCPFLLYVKVFHLVLVERHSTEVVCNWLHQYHWTMVPWSCVTMTGLFLNVLLRHLTQSVMNEPRKRKPVQW